MALTWLEKVGHDIVAFFGKAEPIVADVQAVASPFEAMIFPGLPVLINTTLTAIANAEAMGVAAAASAPTGNNAAKLASVVAAVTPQISTVVTAAGFTFDSPSAVNFVNAIVAAANAFKVTQTPTTVVPPTLVTPGVAPATGAAV